MRTAAEERAMNAPVQVEALPGLRVAMLRGEFPQPLVELPVLPPPTSAPEPDADLRTAVRDMLRQRGYRPTGRGKPSSEYLAGALADGRWPCINAAVDAGNHVSLESGLPVSVVDAELVRGALRVAIAAEGASYVFNLGGQTIDLGGLVCLFDDDGPCANAVKDAQRTKTRPETRSVLAVVWGCDHCDGSRPARAAAALADRWRAAGASVVTVATAVSAG
jgi:DNA/RNA-binding domain of Phe-tRNA-synthetase-like protein